MLSKESISCAVTLPLIASYYYNKELLNGFDRFLKTTLKYYKYHKMLPNGTTTFTPA